MIVVNLVVILIYFVKYKNAANMSGYIVGGQFTNINQFPHSVYVLIVHDHDAYSDSACGGSILNQAIIITAAHCCDDVIKIDIYAGNKQEQKGSLRKVSTYFQHDDYSFPFNDIALMRLNKDLVLGENIGRVVLLQRPPYDETAFVAGWGLSEEGKGVSIYLKHISQRIYRREHCGKINLVNTSMPEGTICGEHWRKLGYPSNGDSGSALVVRNYIQVGLLSYAYTLISDTNSVYTDIGFHYKWIMEYAKRLYCGIHITQRKKKLLMENLL